MDPVKKCFLQACMCHGTLSEEKIKKILIPLCNAYDEPVPDTAEELESFVKSINKALTPYQQALSFIKHPLVGGGDGEKFLVFGYTYESPVAKHQPNFTEEDRYYFGKLLETMVNEPDYGISWNTMYSILNGMAEMKKPLTKNRIQDLVEGWTKQGYFLDNDDKIYFGPRIMVEFESNLKRNYPDLVKECPLCSKVVWWDVKCGDCQIKIHRACIRKYLIKKSNCPVCKKVWSTRLSLSQPVEASPL